MTTIATDGRTMAGDSQVSAGHERVAFRPKVGRAPDGSLFGCAGLSVDCALFAKWFTGEVEEKPKLSDDDFAALVLQPDGRAFYYCGKLEPVEMMLPQAIGSGSEYAIGAMLAGATPQQAVVIACERDTTSGGSVTVMELERLAKAA